MTPTQEALKLGFGATLQSRGVPLWFGSVRFCAVVQPIKADDSEYQVGKTEREMSLVHVDRDCLPEGVVLNSVFKTDDETTAHRVVLIEDHPTRLRVILTCETVPIED